MEALTDIAFDLNELTLDEIEELESLTGLPFDELFGEGKPKAKVLKAVAYLSLRRTNPNITFEEVGKLKLAPGNL